MQKCAYETKIHDIDDLRKRLMQTWFDFWRDHLRSCMRAGGGHFEHMLIYMIHRNVL